MHTGLVDLDVPEAVKLTLTLNVHVELRMLNLLRSVQCEQVCDHPSMLYVVHEVEFDSRFELNLIQIIKARILLRIVDLLIGKPDREFQS